MTRIKLDYVHEYLDRHGKLRRYFRRPGFKQIALPGLPGSDEFMTAYQRAIDLAPRTEIGADRTKPGSIDALIVHYLKSEAFTKALAPETQRMRRNILDRFRTDHGAKRVITLERRHVIKIIEGKPPYAQKNWLKTLRGLMLFAVAENYRANDPTAGVKAAILSLERLAGSLYFAVRLALSVAVIRSVELIVQPDGDKVKVLHAVHPDLLAAK